MTQEMELRAALSKSRLSKVYLLTGNDPYLVKRYSDLIAKKCVPQNTDLNLFELPQDCDVQQIYDALFQFSFTGDKICVRVSDFPFESCPLSAFKVLLSVVEQAPENNVLVLACGATEMNTKKSDRFKKLATAVEKAGGTACDLNHKPEGELVKMLCDGAAKRGVRMEQAVARYMVSVCSNDLNTLTHELQKLAAFVAEGSTVEKETVDLVCVKTVEASVYDMSKQILSGRGQQALQLLDHLIKDGISPAEIHALIASSYVDIFRVRAAQKAGQRADSIAAEFGYPPNRAFVLANAARDGKNLSDRQLSMILQALLAADAVVKNDTKQSGDNAKTALECLIAQIIRISGGSKAV